MSELEHISTVLRRAIKALVEEWEQQREEEEAEHNRFDPDSQRYFDDV